LVANGQPDGVAGELAGIGHQPQLPLLFRAELSPGQGLLDGHRTGDDVELSGGGGDEIGEIDPAPRGAGEQHQREATQGTNGWSSARNPHVDILPPGLAHHRNGGKVNQAPGM
jgi:hypothetical protein